MKTVVCNAKVLGALMSFFMGAGAFASCNEDVSISTKIGYGLLGAMGIVGGASVLIDDMITFRESGK